MTFYSARPREKGDRRDSARRLYREGSLGGGAGLGFHASWALIWKLSSGVQNICERSHYRSAGCAEL